MRLHNTHVPKDTVIIFDGQPARSKVQNVCEHIHMYGLDSVSHPGSHYAMDDALSVNEGSCQLCGGAWKCIWTSVQEVWVAWECVDHGMTGVGV